MTGIPQRKKHHSLCKGKHAPIHNRVMKSTKPPCDAAHKNTPKNKYRINKNLAQKNEKNQMTQKKVTVQVPIMQDFRVKNLTGLHMLFQQTVKKSGLNYMLLKPKSDAEK